MNIFVSNLDPELCAMEHCSTHVVKQILENYQMLSTVHRRYRRDGECDELGLYKKAHHHHPCTLWAGESFENYMWLYRLTRALGEIYTATNGKVHRSEEKLLDALSEPPERLPSKGLTSFALAMPDKYKQLGGYDPERSYQLYLNSKYIDWTTRTDKRRIKPVWWVEPPHWLCPITRASINSMEK